MLLFSFSLLNFYLISWLHAVRHPHFRILFYCYYYLCVITLSIVGLFRAWKVGSPGPAQCTDSILRLSKDTRCEHSSCSPVGLEDLEDGPVVLLKATAGVWCVPENLFITSESVRGVWTVLMRDTVCVG